MNEDLVLTPGGFRPRSLVHAIDPGHILDGNDGKIRKIAPSGQVVADFGPIAHRPGSKLLMPNNVHVPEEKVAAKPFASGWIAYAGWSNDTGTPISLFTTAWVVPPRPKTQSHQTIFLFNGIQNSTMIFQPVLQWGPSAAGSNNQWTVASWYADRQGGHSFHSQLTPVQPGNVLVGVITLTSQSGSSFSYNCQFQGIANSSLPIQNVEELTWCVETLEAYGITQLSNYPTHFTAFRAITIETGKANPTLNWSVTNSMPDTGQHTVVVSNSSTHGEVDIYYRK